jgi:hypothetical protein
MALIAGAHRLPVESQAACPLWKIWPLRDTPLGILWVVVPTFALFPIMPTSFGTAEFTIEGIQLL